MSSVTFSTSVGGDGSTVTDDDNATTGLGNGGALIRLVPMMQQVVNVASHVVSVAGGTGDDASAAAASAVAAGSSATAAAASYDSFDDRYLGSKASDPTLDNDGNALLTGALYWNSSANVMKVYNGGAWSVAYVSASSTGASIRPSLLLDFANSKTLDPRITFTRASTATYTGYDGLIKTATSGSPRFDFNPTTGESLGLLIEEQRTNLLTYSEQFDNAAWIKSNATVTANATTAPNGTVTADKLVEDAVNLTHIFASNFNPANATTYSASVYVKKSERGFAFIGFNIGSMATTFASVNLTTGVIITAIGTFASTPTSQDVGNGWYRISISLTSTGTDESKLEIRPSIDGIWANRAYTGDGTSGIYIWGAQLEAGAFPTSYIPTVASQATRAADNAVITGTNFSSWYRQDEGCLFCKYSQQNNTNAGNIASFNDGTSTNRISLRSGSNPDLLIQTSAVTQVLIPVSTGTANTNMLSAGSYKSNSTNVAINSTIGIEDTSATLPVVSQLSFGSLDSVSYINGHIAKLAYYPKRLSNAELQSITTV